MLRLAVSVRPVAQFCGSSLTLRYAGVARTAQRPWTRSCGTPHGMAARLPSA
jgi:hypothetical protein